VIKNLFNTFDLNEDKKMNFYEFILATVTIMDDSKYEKLRSIFKIYNTDKNKNLDRKEIKHILIDIFNSLEINNYDKRDLDKIINTIFQRKNINLNDKISWNEFSTTLLDDEQLLGSIIPSDRQTESKQAARKWINTNDGQRVYGSDEERQNRGNEQTDITKKNNHTTESF
ncbi:unnamed protein product, partial [Didymodactylos carnosus]